MLSSVCTHARMLDHSDEICVPKIINLVACSVVCVRAHAHVLVDRDEIFALFMINMVACAPAVIKQTVVYQMVVYHFLGKTQTWSIVSTQNVFRDSLLRLCLLEFHQLTFNPK